MAHVLPTAAVEQLITAKTMVSVWPLLDFATVLARATLDHTALQVTSRLMHPGLFRLYTVVHIVDMLVHEVE